MKKKLLLSTLISLLFVCLFTVMISAATYVYSDESGNELYRNTAEFEARNRYERIQSESGSIPKTDSQGNPLTWYVVSDTTGDDGVRYITVSSILTADAGTITNGVFAFTGDVTAQNVVSIDFTGMNITTFGEAFFQSTAPNGGPWGNTTEYCRQADGSYLLFLYLPKTLTAVPNNFCYRSSIRVLEFEDGRIGCKTFPQTAFQFCANLKELRIPEGIETLATDSIRNAMSLSYLSFPSTMTVLENNVFRRATQFETVVYGENMTKIGYLNSEYVTVRDKNKITTIPLKYVYVPAKLITSGIAGSQMFDSHRGIDREFNGQVKSSVVFYVMGDLDYVKALQVVTDKNFRQRYTAIVDYDTYIKDKATYDNKPSGDTPHVIVYGVNPCDVYRNGNHIEKKVDTYKDAVTPFMTSTGCEKCGMNASVTEYEALITFLGYSAKIGGDRIAVGYKISQDTLAFCLEKNPNLSYGVIVANMGEGNSFEPLNPDNTTNGRVIAQEVDKKYIDFNLIVKNYGENDSYYTTPIVMCAYVNDGEKVDYICHNELNEVVISEFASTITYKFIAEEFAPKYAVEYSCDEKMGYLEGELSQIVKDGNCASVVTAVANPGYTFVCWSDGTKTPEIEFKPSKNTNLVAYFAPNSTGLPVMMINTENGADIVTKQYYINCEITLLDTETGNSIGGEVAEIKGRGNSTWEKFPKKPYKFKFDKKQDLFGYGKEKTWVLLADYRDYSLLRNMIALNAGLELSELQYTSKGQSVELYVNGVYKGVYYLCEQIQVKENRVNITQEGDEIGKPEDMGFLVEMDGWAIENASSVSNYTKEGDIYVTVGDALKNNRAYVIKDPEDLFFNEAGGFDPNAPVAKEYLAYVKSFLTDAMSAARGSDYAKVEELIDVKSFAQVYIIFEWFKNPDTNYSSVYFYKDAGGKLICGPLWDFDMAIGNVSHKGNGVFEDTTTLWSKEQNPWFKELLKFEEFRQLVGQELHANADKLRKSVADDLQYAKEHAAAYKKNFDAWTNVMGKLTWSNPDYLIAIETWEEHLDYIENYLDESLDYLLQVYPAPAVEE